MGKGQQLNILITGGAGYIGSVLTEMLLNDGHKVTVMDNLFYKQISIAHFAHNKNFEFVLDDVRDKPLLKKLIQANDVIIPLAAIVGAPACKANPDLTVKINYEQIKDVTECASKNQMIILPNTNSQYGHSTELITEDSPFKPLSLYAVTKCDAEKALLDSGNGIALRLATVFGMSYKMRMDLLVNDFTYKAITDGYVVLFESTFVRNYIHIRDVANVFRFMIQNYESCNNNAFNVGLSAANLTKLELCELIKKYIPDFIIMKNEFRQDYDQRNYVVSNAKLESRGWSPSYTIDDGIKELIKGYQLIRKFKDKDFTNL